MRLILVAAHDRRNFGELVAEIGRVNKDFEVPRRDVRLFSFHLNPNVYNIAINCLG